MGHLAIATENPTSLFFVLTSLTQYITQQIIPIRRKKLPNNARYEEKWVNVEFIRTPTVVNVQNARPIE
jgi:hypothetical protein